MFGVLKLILDLLRWGLIVGSLALSAMWLWGFAWWAAAVWLTVGFIILINVWGFATLPLYLLIGRFDPAVQALREFEEHPERFG